MFELIRHPPQRNIVMFHSFGSRFCETGFFCETWRDTPFGDRCSNVLQLAFSTAPRLTLKRSMPLFPSILSGLLLQRWEMDRPGQNAQIYSLQCHEMRWNGSLNSLESRT